MSQPIGFVNHKNALYDLVLLNDSIPSGNIFYLDAANQTIWCGDHLVATIDHISLEDLSWGLLYFYASGEKGDYVGTIKLKSLTFSPDFIL